MNLDLDDAEAAPLWTRSILDARSALLYKKRPGPRRLCGRLVFVVGPVV